MPGVRLIISSSIINIHITIITISITVSITVSITISTTISITISITNINYIGPSRDDPSPRRTKTYVAPVVCKVYGGDR